MEICPKFGKKDILFLTAICVLSLVIYGGLLAMSKSGSKIRISVEGAEYGLYALSQEQTIPISIDGTVENTVVIADGKAWMQSATCPDGLCKRQGKISRQGETIVCLPHQVVVEVIAAKKSKDLDAVAS